MLASGMTDSTPPKLKGYRDARAYFGVISDVIDTRAPDPDLLGDLAIAFERSIEEHKVRDWVGNRDVENRMKRDLDDLLYQANHDCGWQLSNAEQDAVLDGVIEVARRRVSLP